MVWIVKLEERQEGKIVSRRKVFTIDRPMVIDSSDDIGLGREDANALLSSLQQILVTSQFDHDAGHRGACDTCGQKRNVKDYRSRKIDTLYGRVTIRRPRYLCPHCGPCHSPLIASSTPEFDLIRSTLAAHLPYRVASELLSTLLPADSGTTHTTIRNRIAHVAEQLKY